MLTVKHPRQLEQEKMIEICVRPDRILASFLCYH